LSGEISQYRFAISGSVSVNGPPQHGWSDGLLIERRSQRRILSIVGKHFALAC